MEIFVATNLHLKILCCLFFVAVDQQQKLNDIIYFTLNYFRVFIFISECH